jgi:frataxin-like iron-binding protein CyaY
MNREQIRQALEKIGVSVVGTTEEFNGAVGGLWISAEASGDHINYHSVTWYDTFGVDPSLSLFVEENGWYFEWYDPGTIMLWQS